MTNKNKETKIDRFWGEFRFLSNFWPCPIEYDDYIYSSVEAAYQAAKTEIPAERAFVRDAETPGEAKRIGQTVTLRPDWEDIKLEIMFWLVHQKFFNIPQLGKKLLATEDAELSEGNFWHDIFFGICDGKCKKGPHAPCGEDYLGGILMDVRDELKRKETKSNLTDAPKVVL